MTMVMVGARVCSTLRRNLDGSQAPCQHLAAPVQACASLCRKPYIVQVGPGHLPATAGTWTTSPFDGPSLHFMGAYETRHYDECRTQPRDMLSVVTQYSVQWQPSKINICIVWTNFLFFFLPCCF